MSHVRLSVNITSATDGALQRIATREGLSITEALRRLISYGEVLDIALVEGAEVLVRHDGQLERLLLM
jgi:hypothetical protein